MDTNTVIIIIALILGLLFIRKIFGARVPAEAELTPDEFESKLSERSTVVIDVRTANEYSAGKIKGARNISYPGGGFKPGVEKMDKGQTYLVYCLSGSRSAGALSRMKAMDFTNVYHLKGGLNNWRSSGKRMVR